MKIMSKINITNPGRSKLPIGNAAVAKAPSPEVTVGNTFSAGVSRLPSDDQMLLEEEERNAMFRKSQTFTK